MTGLLELADIGADDLTQLGQLLATLGEIGTLLAGKVEAHQHRLHRDGRHAAARPLIIGLADFGHLIFAQHAWIVQRYEMHVRQQRSEFRLVGQAAQLGEQADRLAGDVEHGVGFALEHGGHALQRRQIEQFGRLDSRQLQQIHGGQPSPTALLTHHHPFTRQAVERLDRLAGEQMHFLVVEREDQPQPAGELTHLRAFRTAEEPQHVGLHDAEGGIFLAIDALDVVDRTLGVLDQDIQTDGFGDAGNVVAKLDVGAGLGAGHHADLFGIGLLGHGRRQAQQTPHKQ